MTRAIVRTPGPELAQCELTHLERRPIDVNRALAQHADYVSALESCGAAVNVLPPLEGHADACFVEDPAIVLDDVAVMTRPAPASRRGEVATLARELATQRPVRRIESGSLEGGDVLAIGKTLFVGRSTRTDEAGIEALRALVAEFGIGVVPVEVKGALHLKTAVTWLGDDTIVANAGWVDLEPLRAFRKIEIDADEPFGGNVLRIGDSLVVSTAAPRTSESIAATGRDVVAVDISEFHRAEAGLTCLSLVFPRRLH